jgi:hypothetical protein
METFNEPVSFVMMSKHKIAPPTLTLEEDVAESFNLNTTDTYRVTIEGKPWGCVFRRWHGQHCLFYCPMRDNTIAVHYTDLRKLVKRVKES